MLVVVKQNLIDIALITLKYDLFPTNRAWGDNVVGLCGVGDHC